MHGDIASALPASFETTTIGDTVHDVPPHTVVEVIVDGTRAVCKHDTGPTGSAGYEGRVMALVGRETDIPVPTILDVGPSHFVAAWCETAPTEAAAAATVDWAGAAGRGMARLHEETAPLIDGYGPFTLDGETVGGGPHDTWHAAAIAYLEDRALALEPYGYASSARAAIEHLERHPEAFDGAGEPVCCHGWFTPEHVAVDADAVACVIDFEHAIAAPAEFDCWRMVAPAFGPGEPDDRQRAFFEAYESVRPLSDGVERRQRWFVLLNLVYFLESLFVQDQHDPDETDQLAERYAGMIEDAVGG